MLVSPPFDGSPLINTPLRKWCHKHQTAVEVETEATTTTRQSTPGRTMVALDADADAETQDALGVEELESVPQIAFPPPEPSKSKQK